MTKENFYLEEDIPTWHHTASSFPEGIVEAHHTLKTLLPYVKERKLFGVSSPGQTGTIVYKAAAEILPGEEKSDFSEMSLLIKKGNYTSILIKNYNQNIPAIGQAFEELLENPDIDPKGSCVEWYLNESDVRCMVRLKG